MSVKQNFPTIRPTLNLDFAGSQVVDSRITFTRASAATVTNAQGVLKTIRDNKPRIDFDPNTGECKGLLIEGQRVNLYNRSNYPQLWDTINASFVPNADIAPDGTMSATLIRATTSDPFFYQTVSSLPGNVVVSIWVKASGTAVGKTGTIRISGNAVTTPVFTTSWQRISAAFNVTGTYIVGFELPDSGAAVGDQVYVWGAQVEAGSFATSYIPSMPTFTSRSTSATYFDSNGVLRTAPINGPRYGYGYDSTTGKWISQGLLLENAATNLVPNSNLFGNTLGYEAIWTKTNNSTDVTAPDGSSLTTKMVSGTSGNTWYWTELSNGTYAANSVYTHSVWIRTATGTTATVGFQPYPYNGGGTVTVTDKWQRISATFTTNGSGTSPYIGLVSPQVSSTFYVWGWQVEGGSIATSYIPTFGGATTRAADVSTSTATTRAADNAIIKALEFTKLNSSTECTLYGEGTTISGPSVTNGRPALVTISNNLDRDTHRFILRRNDQLDDAAQSGFNYRLATVLNGTSYSIDHASVNGVQPEWEDYAIHKTIFSVSTVAQQAFGDGVSAGITSISIPNFDKFNQLEIGNGASSSYWNGHIRKITYYNKKLTDTQAQALTV